MKRDRVRNSSLESWQIDAEKLDEGVTAYGGLPMADPKWPAAIRLLARTATRAGGLLHS